MNVPENTPHRSGSGRIGRRVIDGLLAGGATLARHWRLALAVAAIAVFAIGPGITGSQPEFYQRFERFSPYYKSWTVSQHARVNCQSCHVPPRWTDRATYHLRTTGEVYLSLLPLDRAPETLGKPANAACESCHIDLRAVSPSGDLNIPHRAHVDKLKVRCTVCHSRLVHGAGTQQGTKPRMATCLTCHDGKKAKSGCEVCHRSKGEPESHDSKDWLMVHADRQEQEDCKECHAWNDKWCADCHSQRPASHGTASNPAVWRKTHGAAVDVRRNCEVCHDERSCVRCHGEQPRLNFNPALRPVQ
jgi:hypothetical protein